MQSLSSSSSPPRTPPRSAMTMTSQNSLLTPPPPPSRRCVSIRFLSLEEEDDHHHHDWLFVPELYTTTTCTLEETASFVELGIALPAPTTDQLVAVFEETDENVPPSTTTSRVDGGVVEVVTPPPLQEDACCSICWQEFVRGDALGRSFHCSHIFHATCIQEWLLTAVATTTTTSSRRAPRNTCPCCRQAFAAPPNPRQRERGVMVVCGPRQRQRNCHYEPPDWPFYESHGEHMAPTATTTTTNATTTTSSPITPPAMFLQPRSTAVPSAVL